MTVPPVPPVPLIGLPACVRDIGIHPFHVVGDKYMRAVVDAAGGLPVSLPALGGSLDQSAVIERCDGLLFTGSPSNVEPANYEGPPSADGTLHDPERDATTLPLIRNAIDAGVPIFCICRGFQELNVALGGSLPSGGSRPARADRSSLRRQPAPRRAVRARTRCNPCHRRPAGLTLAGAGGHGQFAARPGDRSPRPAAPGRGDSARRSDRGRARQRRARLRARRAVAPRVEGHGGSVLDGDLRRVR